MVMIIIPPNRLESTYLIACPPDGTRSQLSPPPLLRHTPKEQTRETAGKKKGGREGRKTGTSEKGAAESQQTQGQTSRARPKQRRKAAPGQKTAQNHNGDKIRSFNGWV